MFSSSDINSDHSIQGSTSILTNVGMHASDMTTMRIPSGRGDCKTFGVKLFCPWMRERPMAQLKSSSSCGQHGRFSAMGENDATPWSCTEEKHSHRLVRPLPCDKRRVAPLSKKEEEACLRAVRVTVVPGSAVTCASVDDSDTTNTGDEAQGSTENPAMHPRGK